MKLKEGMIVLTPRGEMQLEGVNGAHRWMWYAQAIVKGEIQKESCRLITNEDVIAIKTENGFQTILPGVLPKEKPF